MRPHGPACIALIALFAVAPALAAGPASTAASPPPTFTREDARGDYGERRFISTARLRGRVHVCVWTLRDGQPRIISLRKANTRERARHAAEEKLH